MPPAGVLFRGQVRAVKARMRLIPAFDQISHQYQGFTLVIAPTEAESPGVEPMAIGFGSAFGRHQLQSVPLATNDVPEIILTSRSHQRNAGGWKRIGTDPEAAHATVGTPRKVPGRKPWMVWIDNDIEREVGDRRL
jgi:hypothetical protein